MLGDFIFVCENHEAFVTVEVCVEYFELYVFLLQVSVTDGKKN